MPLLRMRAYIDPIPRLKQQMAGELTNLLGDATAEWAGAMLNTDPRRILEIRHGNLTRFSLPMLIRHVTRLGYAVELRVVRLPPAGRQARQISAAGGRGSADGKG